jgi:hypothetical protein
MKLSQLETLKYRSVGPGSVGKDMGSFAGARLSTVKCKAAYVEALVVGEDCVLSCSNSGKVVEWALPDPQATVEEAKPRPAKLLRRWEKRWWSGCMQVWNPCPPCCTPEDPNHGYMGSAVSLQMTVHTLHQRNSCIHVWDSWQVTQQGCQQ